MKKRYIELMAKTLTAYGDEDVRAYFDRVKKEGLTEHGFPRLIANIGILIANGVRTDLLPLFCEMMEFCCRTIPGVKAANDFSVKEVLFCILELEKHKTLPVTDTARWRDYLQAIDPSFCYNKFAEQENDLIFNWALFTALSEYMRQYAGLCDTSDFVDLQLATQVRWMDENGMYRDALHHPPMQYDLVVRGLFALLLHLGYRGKYFDTIDSALKKAGLLTLDMQSVTGEAPFGGRSNQFLHNEAHLAIILEYEAGRYQREGDPATAKRFKSRVKTALDNIALWLEKTPIRHVKNSFPLASKYGCEDYAYFDKYMITVASFLYAASLICDDTISEESDTDTAPVAVKTSPWFHKVFLKSGGYALELDTDADPHYDASGLGRVHRAGAPSAICLSVPCPENPTYTIDNPKAMAAALCPGIAVNGSLVFATYGHKTPYRVTSLSQTDGEATVTLTCDYADVERILCVYTVSERGVYIKAESATEGREVVHLLPALDFDGETKTVIKQSENSVEVFYQGWVCRYTANGRIGEMKKSACNRNGRYRCFYAGAKNTLEIRIEIVRA